MSFIIGTKCVSECDTGCVDVCPVDCIHGPIDINGSGKEVEGLRESGKLDLLMQLLLLLVHYHHKDQVGILLFFLQI